MATHPLPKISEAEYLERERSASFRSEYIFGQMYAMAGASLRHNRINRNVLASPASGLEACEALASDQRVYSPRNPFFAYPDTLLYCGEPKLMPDAFKDTLMNPCLIVEILSDSTREYDLNLKFEMYKDISSFREYLAIEQDFVCVHHYRLLDSGWDHQELRSLEDVVRLLCGSGEVPLTAVYRGIEFAT